MPELEPLETEIVALLSEAKPVVELDAGTKARISAQIEAKLALPPPEGGDGGGDSGSAAPSAAGPSASTAFSSFGTARVVAAFLGTFAAGVATGVVVEQKRAPAAPTAAAPSPLVTSPALPLPAHSALNNSPPAIPVSDLPRVEQAPKRTSSAVSAASSADPPVPSTRGLSAERALLDVARNALARGAATEALAAADRHARDYPEGVLSEEREAIVIKALIALGRNPEARVRAQRFEQRFPNALMLHAIRAALEGDASR